MFAAGAVEADLPVVKTEAEAAPVVIGASMIAGDEERDRVVLPPAAVADAFLVVPPP